VSLGWTQESSAIHRNADRLGMNRYSPPRRMLKVSMLVMDAFLRRALSFARRKPCRVRRTHQGGSLLAGESISGRIAHRGRERLRLSYRRWIIGACQQRLEPRSIRNIPTRTTTAATRTTTRATTTAPSPTIARRSGSTRNMPKPTAELALQRRAKDEAMPPVSACRHGLPQGLHRARSRAC
jgi:hypothetical protein